MKHAYKIAPAALMLLAAWASPAAAAPGPIEAILSAPFEMGAGLVHAVFGMPAALAAQPHQARRGARHGAMTRVHHRKRHAPAYRFKEPVENF